MLRHPNYMTVEDRDLLDEKWVRQPQDVRQQLAHTLRWHHEVGRSFAGAFAFNGKGQGVAYKTVAPGFVRSQAGGEATMEYTTVPFVGAEDRSKELAGFHHAVLSAKDIPAPTLANRNLDTAQPCNLDEWFMDGLAASYDPLGEGRAGQGQLCLQTTRVWTGPGTTRKEVTHEWEPETFGFPGKVVPVNRSGASIWTLGGIPDNFTPHKPVIPDLGVLLNAMFAWNDVLLLGKSGNFGSRQTKWLRASTLVLSAEINKHSAFFSDPNDPLEIAILAYEPISATLTLFSAEFLIGDFMTTPLSLTELESWSSGTINPGDSFRLHAHILIDEIEIDYWIVAFRNRNGVQIVRSTDGGASFGSVEGVGAAIPSMENINTPIAIAVYNERLVVVDTDGTTDLDGDRIQYVYTASTKAGSLSKINNPTDWSVASTSVGLVSTSSAIVGLVKKAAPEPDNALSIVDFDGSTYPDYTISGGGDSNGEAGSAFYPAQGDMAFGSTNGPSGFETAFCNVTVDLTAYYTFNEVSLWTDYLAGWTLDDRSSEIVVTLLDVDDSLIAEYALQIAGAFPEDEAYTITAADLGLDGSEQTAKVVVAVRLFWTDGGGGPGTTIVFIDDIDIDADLIEYDTDRALHTLNLGTSTYTKRNSFQRLPFDHYGIAVDGVSRARISVIAYDESGNQPALLNSVNSGAAWSKVRDVGGFVGLKRSNDIAILFGYTRLHLSNDAGATSYDLSGDWLKGVGPLGLIKGITGVL
jgi:hypothetical protein